MGRKTGSANHIHKYYRLTDTGLWYCGADNCSHFMPGNMPPPTGKMSRCWSCEKPFQLAPYNMQDVQPECDDCMERHARMEAAIEGEEINPMFLGMSPATIEKVKAAIERNRLEREEEELTKVGSMEDLVESEVIHAPDCEIHEGLLCTCGLA